MVLAWNRDRFGQEFAESRRFTFEFPGFEGGLSESGAFRQALEGDGEACFALRLGFELGLGGIRGTDRPSCTKAGVPPRRWID